MNQNQQSQLKDLITKGKEQGFLTYAEVNDHLPDDIVDPEQIEDIINMINDMGISVHEEAPDTDELILNDDATTDSDDETAAEEAAAALEEGHAQGLPPPGQSRLDGPDGDPQHLGDLLGRQPAHGAEGELHLVAVEVDVVGTEGRANVEVFDPDFYPGDVEDAEAAGAMIAYPPTRQGDTGTWAIYVLGDVQIGLWQQ